MSRPFQPGQKVSLAFRKCECFVILTEAIWIKVRSAANRVGTCAIFVTAHPHLKRVRTTFLNPRQCQESLTGAVNFYSYAKVLQGKVFIQPLQGQSMISMRCRWSRCIEFLEVRKLSLHWSLWCGSRGIDNFPLSQLFGLYVKGELSISWFEICNFQQHRM